MKKSQHYLINFAVTAASLAAIATSLAQSSDWNGYLFDLAHSSHNVGATAITTANASTLTPDWTFVDPQPTMTGQPAASIYATPTVYQGVIYIGSNTGMFYAINESTGAMLWNQLLGFTTPISCGSGHGVTAAAKVATDPVSGALTVYIGGGDGYLYALDAATGTIVFRQFVVDVGTKKNTGFIWGSPTIESGRIYLGFASACDNPLVRSNITSFDQHTGAPLKTFWTLPLGETGAGVWSTPASDGKSLWIDTGNGDSGGSAYAMVKLGAGNLHFVDQWINPTDGDLDWGSSPVLFQARVNRTMTQMVGANGKDGVFHALDRNNLSNGPIWSFQIGATADFSTGTCLAAPIWDSTTKMLFVAGTLTTINGTQYSGSVRAFNPADGTIIWETGVNGGPIMGSPTLNGSGVIAAGTYNIQNLPQNAVYLLRESTGAILATIPQPNSIIFGQPVFAGNHLFIATASTIASQGTLTSYTPAALRSIKK